MTRPHICPFCQCEKRRSRAKRPMDYAQIEQAQKIVREMEQRYGSISAAGRAYSERFALKEKSGERYFNRVLRGDQRISYYGLDRLEVFAAG